MVDVYLKLEITQKTKPRTNNKTRQLGKTMTINAKQKENRCLTRNPYSPGNEGKNYNLKQLH